MGSKNVDLITKEFFDLIVGQEIGRGTYRTVYSCASTKNWVFKFQEDNYCFDNVMEWEVWKEYQHVPEIAKWLAPCHYISANGNILIQERTGLITDLPKEMPAFLCDTKPKNYGVLGKGKNKRVVCHDYAYLINSRLNTKMKKTKWWETESIYK